METFSACGLPQKPVQRKSDDEASASQWDPDVSRTPAKGRLMALTKATVPLALELQL